MGTIMKYEQYSKYYDNRDVISLFSGAMGLDIGLAKAGLNVVIGQDFDASCVKTMRANGHNVLEGDIREIEPQQLLSLTGLLWRTISYLPEGHLVSPFLQQEKDWG